MKAHLIHTHLVVQKIKAIYQGQGPIPRSHFKKENGHRRGICVSQARLVVMAKRFGFLPYIKK